MSHLWRLRQAARVARGAVARCPPTLEDVLGPAYRAGAPFRARLCDEDEPGVALLVEGAVRSAESCAPVGGALLDVWQADARGWYSDLLGLAPRGDPARMRLRGRLTSDDDGSYRIETVLPGHYPLGPLSRPRHIHFLVTKRGYASLVTQLYFAGDEKLAPRHLRRDGNVVPLEERAGEGRPGLRARFDLALRPSAAARGEGRAP